VIANNTPKFVATGKNLGPVDPHSTIDVSIWLNVRNRSELDAVAADLYNPKSADYRRWLSKGEFVARFAPTAAEAKTVQDFFTANGLTVLNVGPENFSVTARGTVADVQRAFHVAIHNFLVGGQILRANTSDPVVEGAAGALVGAVYGLDNLPFQHPAMSRNGTPAGKTAPPGRLASRPEGVSAGAGPSADPAFFTTNCFTGLQTESYTTGGSLPDATYKGNGYTNSTEGCGYTPAEIHAAYNLNALYQEGFDGTGQTIVIIDWCGSPTIRGDANAFSARFGLPPLTTANFKIIPYPTPSTCAAPDPEISIDVEWAHAIAPGAVIDLVVPPTNSATDIDNALLYAAINQLGNVISGSYYIIGGEVGTPGNLLVTENLICEVAAVLGESANFSSGDQGDYTTTNLPGTYPATVSNPADSPWATAVGGVSLALNANNTIKWQSGWGTNQNLLIDEGSISDPPANGYFWGGAGGGASAFFKKPPFQSSLPGKTRQLPDVSWLADPFTGGVIAITYGFMSPPLTYQVWGGTSLACPMFSALWAIANQEAGYPLGQAAHYLYSLPSDTIYDVVPLSSAANVTATIVDFLGTTTYSAAQLAAPLGITAKFYSTLWDYPLVQDTTYVLTFGTDTSLATAKGWDNVTGVGTPKDAKAFADYFSF
jgi:subtilase family serine protease